MSKMQDLLKKQDQAREKLNQEKILQLAKMDLKQSQERINQLNKELSESIRNAQKNGMTKECADKIGRITDKLLSETKSHESLEAGYEVLKDVYRESLRKDVPDHDNVGVTSFKIEADYEDVSPKRASSKAKETIVSFAEKGKEFAHKSIAAGIQHLTNIRDSMNEFSNFVTTAKNNAIEFGKDKLSQLSNACLESCRSEYRSYILAQEKNCFMKKAELEKIKEHVRSIENVKKSVGNRFKNTINGLKGKEFEDLKPGEAGTLSKILDKRIDEIDSKLRLYRMSYNESLNKSEQNLMKDTELQNFVNEPTPVQENQTYDNSSPESPDFDAIDKIIAEHSSEEIPKERPDVDALCKMAQDACDQIDQRTTETNIQRDSSEIGI